MAGGHGFGHVRSRTDGSASHGPLWTRPVPRGGRLGGVWGPQEAGDSVKDMEERAHRCHRREKAWVASEDVGVTVGSDELRCGTPPAPASMGPPSVDRPCAWM